jgi:hypothetical protein
MPGRPITSLALALAALALVSGRPAAAQTVEADIARALRTLSEIERLIDSIQVRNGGLAQGTSIATAPSAEWKPLFNGQNLDGWKLSGFGGAGEVRVEKAYRGGPAAIIVEMGASLSGITYTGTVPRTGYEISVEWMKIDGSDFACGLTFPVADSHASLILGGWGGGVVGISSIDHRDASENDTTQYLGFIRNKWYHVRMRVLPDRLQAWLDDKKIMDQDIRGHVIGLRAGDISRSVPLGLATYQTSAAFRDIKIRSLSSP